MVNPSVAVSVPNCDVGGKFVHWLSREMQLCRAALNDYPRNGDSRKLNNKEGTSGLGPRSGADNNRPPCGAIAWFDFKSKGGPSQSHQ
jgi:hypothetical protein